MTTSKTTMLLTASVLALLTACGSSSSNSPAAPAPAPVSTAGTSSNPTGLQMDFRSQALAASKLTAAQKAEFSSLSLSHEAYSPNVNLYFDTYSDDADKQRDQAQLNGEGLDYITKVRANCTITPGQEQESGDRSSGHVHTNHEARSITGNNCPISYSYDSKTILNTTAFDESSGMMSGTLHTDTIENKQIIDIVMLRNMYIGSQVVNTSADAIFQNYKSDENANAVSGSAYFTRKTAGTLVTADGKTINVGGKAEVFKSKNSNSMQSLIKMALPSGTNVVIGVFQTGDKLEMLVNGESYTSQRFQTEFGENPGF